MLLNFKSGQHQKHKGSQKPNQSVDDRALPVADFNKLNARFRFTLDAAASRENCKLPRFYSEENCGLQASWTGERVYCNPPYGDIEPWCVKAWEEKGARLIVMLLPANRTEQSWWQNHIEPYRDRAMSPLTTEFLRGRLRFLKPGQKKIGPNERPPFGIVLCVWER